VWRKQRIQGNQAGFFAGTEPAVEAPSWHSIRAGEKAEFIMMNKLRLPLLGTGAAFLLFVAAAGCNGSSDDDDGTGGAETGGTGGTATGGTSTGTGGVTTGGSPSTGGSGGSDSSEGGDGGDGGQGGAEGDRDEDPVNLRAAADYVILAKTAISTVAPSVITGDIGLSPASSGDITGFSLVDDATGEFASSVQVTGDVFAADFEAPTPSDLADAVDDLEAAYDDAEGRSADVTDLRDGDIGGRTLQAGVYRWDDDVSIDSDLTLSGDSNDVWIFQIDEDLIVDAATSVVLTGGAQVENVFWQVAGDVEIGAGADFVGVVLGRASVTVDSAASLTGRVLAQTSVTLDGCLISEP